MSLDRIKKISQKEPTDKENKVIFNVQLKVDNQIIDVEVPAVKLLSYNQFQKFVLETKGILFRMSRIEGTNQAAKTRLWLNAIQELLKTDEK